MQTELFVEQKSLVELLEKKNEYFSEALNTVSAKKSGKTSIVWKTLFCDGSDALVKVAPNRSLHREMPDFTAEEVENWPAIIIAIDNRPDQQLLFVQSRAEAFQSTETPAKIVAGAVSSVLARYHLRVHVEPIVDANDFWNLISRYEGKISQVQFELITPNMSNISSVLRDDLKNFSKSTNSAVTQVSLQSDPDSALKLESGDDQLAGLVKYSNDGGGNIRIKAKGLKKTINTAENKRTVEVADLEIEGKSPEAIINVLKQLF